MVHSLKVRLAERQADLQADQSAIEAELKQYRKVQHRLEEMGLEATRARTSIEGLAACYQEADPDLLVLPVAPPEGKAEKPPANIEATYVDESEATASDEELSI